MMMAQLKWVALGQVTNLVLPIVLFPLLAHRLGVAGFAAFAVVTGISQYATLGVELGLNHVGMARMHNAEDPTQKSRIFTAILASKLWLTGLMLVVLAGFIHWRAPMPGFSTGWVLALSAGSLLTCLVYPAWFFTQAHRQDLNFRISFWSRVGLFAAVWWLVQSERDVWVAVALFNFAFIPVGLCHVRHWLIHVDVSTLLDGSATRTMIRQGLGMSGAAVRETVTSLGMAPLYGMMASGPAVGLLAFAEKVAKILVLPAPMVASVVMVNRVRMLQSAWLHRLRQGDRWLVAAMLMGCVLVGWGYAVAVSWAIHRWFSAYVDAIPVIQILVAFFPFVYANYLIVSVLHTGRENFTTVGRLSYAYVLLLIVGAMASGRVWGSMALAAVMGGAELILFIVLLRGMPRGERLGDEMKDKESHE